MSKALPITDPAFQEQFKAFCANKFIVKVGDMPKEMESEVRETIMTGIEKNNVESKTDMEAACKYIKDTMDQKYGASWHCMMGRGFAYDITSNKDNLIHGYYCGSDGNFLGVLLYKC